MPVLANSRHELFAQGIASGRTLDDAYSDAGFARNGANASTLHKKKLIQSRVEELLAERANQLLQKTATEASYTRDILLAQLEDARTIAKEARNGSAMAMATMGMAKILGLIIDRREVGDAGTFDKMSDAELVEAVRKSADGLGLDVPDNLLQFPKPEP